MNSQAPSPAYSLKHVAQNRDQAMWTLGRMEMAASLYDFAKPLVLECKPYSETRRSVQNRRHWAVLGNIAEAMASEMGGVYHTPETWHELFKRRFLGYDVVELKDGPVEVPRSSRKLTVAEFAEFDLQIEAWAAGEGIHIEGGP